MFDKAYKILAIDDAKDGLMLLTFDLEEAGCQVSTASSGESALAFLAHSQVDCIIMDMYMPGLTGLATLELLKNDSRFQELPVIMLSASDLEDEIVAALELGAADYVVKPYRRKVLLARVHTALRLREKNLALTRFATTDFLTEINNYRSFYQLAVNVASQALRNKYNVVIARFDIDFFKQVNDEYGHHVGEQVLKVFAQCMSHGFRGYDIIGRFGGEAFVVCLPNIDIKDAMIACERFRLDIVQLDIPCDVNSGINSVLSQVQITVSGGVASSSQVSLDIDKLLQQANVALDHAKATGRNTIINISDLLDSAQTSLTSPPKEAPLVTNHKEDNRVKECDIDISPAENLTIDGIEITVGLNNVLGDQPLYCEILQMFCDEHKDDANKLNKAIAECDYQTAKHVAHTLKGVSSSVGAMTLFELSKQLDSEINNQNTELQPLLAKVTAQLQKVMENIQLALVK